MLRLLSALLLLMSAGVLCAQAEHPVWKVQEVRRDPDRIAEVVAPDTTSMAAKELQAGQRVAGPHLCIRFHPWRWCPSDVLDRVSIGDLFGLIDLLDGQ